TAVFRGHAEADRLNELVLRAGLDWRQITVLRAYARYLRQIDIKHSQNDLFDALLGAPRTAAALVQLFEARFDPSRSEQHRQRKTANLGIEIDGLIDEASTRQLLILREYAGLIHATVR